MDLTRQTVATLRRELEDGRINPLDIVDAHLDAIEQRDGDVHAFLDVHADSARDAARRLTDDGSYRTLPLGGIPVALKDNICTTAGRTTCASKILEHYSSPYDATVVSRLRSAGAIVIGKTNLDEFAMGSSTENSAFGPSHNPWNLERAPGGSSGGSAAAVAAGLAPVALGSDTGGSIRQPASFCGVVGMKPTYGCVSRYGLVAFASSLDQIGPLTRSVADAARVTRVIAGHDRNDSTTLRCAMGQREGATDADADARTDAPLTIGVPRSFVEAAQHAEVQQNFDDVVERLSKRGVQIVNVELPHAEYASAAYYVVANAEASTNLARFDGVRYGHRSRNSPDLDAMYANTRAEGFGAEVKRRILLGTYVLSAGYYDAYYHRAMQVRSLMIRDYEAAFGRCDLIATPTSPTPAFPLGERVDDPLAMYLADAFTIPVSLAGLPAISVPSGRADDGLPLGFQLAGRPCDEETVFRGALRVESVAGFTEAVA